jgi:hypothetical protein
MREIRNTQRIFIGKPEGEAQPGMAMRALWIMFTCTINKLNEVCAEFT